MNYINTRRSWNGVTPDRWFHTLILACVLALFSFFAATVGGVLLLRPEMLWPFWPGCAFLVAVLLVVPRRIWPILIPAGLAGFVVYDLWAGLPLRSIALLILSDTVEILIAAVGVSYAFHSLPRLDSMKSLARYSFFAVLLPSLASTSIATAPFGGNYWIRWRIGFFTEALALLTLTPAILNWVSTRHALTRKSRAFYFEAVMLLAGLAVLGYAAFAAHSRSNFPVLLYSLLPFLLWSALRFGMMGTSTSMIVVAFLSTWGAVRGRGPFVGAERLNSVLSLQLFLLVAGTTFMVLVVLVEERKEAERGIREGEERLRVAAEVGRMYAWEWDPATDAVLRSAECADILGLSDTAREGLAKDYFSCIHPDDRAELRTLVESLTPEVPVYGTQYRWFGPDGSLRWLGESARATFDGAGKMVRLVGMTADVTERMRAEEALKKSEEKFSKAFRQSPMALTITSTKDHRYIEVNETFESLSGWSRDEVIGRTPFDIGLWVHPTEREDLINQLLTDGHLRNSEASFRTRDGSIRTGLITAELIELNGELCAIGVTADITERKQAEEAPCRSQERLSGIIASAMDAVISVDRNEHIVLFNPAAEEMFRCSSAEALGHPIERFIPERFRSAHTAHVQRFAESGPSNRAMGGLSSLCALRADGQEFQIEASISNASFGSEQLFTVILRDITERKWAEEALRASEERFSKAFRSSPLAITISTQAEGRYLDVNAAFLQMLG